MTAMRVEAGRGWGWIVEGWRLFAQAPGIWIVILLIYLGLIPILFQRVTKKLRLFPRKGGRHDGLSQIISGRDSLACPSAY